MIKFLFLFLFSLNASANLFGRGMLMTKAALPPPSANIRCWKVASGQSSGSGICGSLSNNNSNTQVSSWMGAQQYTFKYDYYCPGLPTLNTWSVGGGAISCDYLNSTNMTWTLDNNGPLQTYLISGYQTMLYFDSLRIYVSYWNGSSCVEVNLSTSCQTR